MSTRLDIDNVSRWTLNHFKELEGLLHDLIPLIRWFQISAKEFWRKVSPFEQIFPKQLYKDIIGHYLDPETPPISVMFLGKTRRFSGQTIFDGGKVFDGWQKDSIKM
ncbi:85_t:CDS:2 [Funneliformis caledonium]|uniref:85_t:CDS:1 n=1 Tax=Funneliformis caledonium TaxID=1117310 RepID=A0A9N8ZI81_9GLOM|nr:85_t:CDS:2 [Funneliformis caledonium]